MNTRTVFLVVVLAAALVLAGCSSDSPTAPPKPTPTAQGVTLTVAKDVAGVNEAVVAEARVTVSGQPAPDGTSVTFTASEPGFFVDNNSSELVRTTSAGGRATAAVNSAVAANVQVTARVPGGQASRTIRFEGSRNPLDLAIYSVTPNRGRPEGGQQVMIRGQGFSLGARVFFLVGGTSYEAQVTGVDVTGTQLTVATPPVDLQAAAVSEQVADITVEIQEFSATMESAFTFEKIDAQPRLYSVVPNAGSHVGGETVTVFGTNLYPPVRVLFGNNEAYVVNVSADHSQIQVRTPARQVGVSTPETVTLTVYTRVGTANQEVVTLPNAFTYYYQLPPPVIYYLVPNRGSDRGSEEVTIHGEWLVNPQVNFSLGGAAQVTATDPEGRWVRVLTPDVTNQNLTADTPVDVTVTNATGSQTLPSAFVYIAEASMTPEIYAISPNSGPLEGGTRVTITGRRFAYPVQVFFGDRMAQVVSVNFNEIICLAPSMTQTQPDTPTTVPVTVKNVASGQVSNPVDYRYGEALFISGISPNSGSMLGGTVVTIYGQGFSPPVRVVIGLSFGELEMEVMSVAGTEIIARTKPVPENARSCATQAGPVIITNLNSNLTAEGPEFIYLATNPLISSVEVVRISDEVSLGNMVPEYRPDNGCNVPYNSYRVHIRGSGFEKRPGTEQSAMVVNFAGIGGDIPTTWVSEYEVTAQLIDLTGLTLQEIDCMVGNACGRQYVDTPFPVTITNTTNTCTDTLGGALFLRPCNTQCRIEYDTLRLELNPPSPLIVGDTATLTAWLELAGVPNSNQTPVTVTLDLPPVLTGPEQVVIPRQGTGVANLSADAVGSGTILASVGSGMCMLQATLPVTVNPEP